MTRARSGRAVIGVGLLSGTSMDAVDAAVCRIDGGPTTPRVEVLAFTSTPYARGLRARLRTVAEGGGDAATIARLHRAVGECLATAARAALADAGVRRAAFVASHGQTIRHEPGRRGRPTITLQIGDPAPLARDLGCPVVADLRAADCAAGGQGAPLTPLADWLLLRRRGRVRAVQNLGGIGNVTFVTPRRDAVVAFDTGPANLPLDEAARAVSGGRAACDRGGRRARRGRVDEGVLRGLLRHPFLGRRPPRSTGREEFGAAFVDAVRRRHPGLSADDLLATLTEFVAAATVGACRRWGPASARPDEVLLAGGGARNPALVAALERRFAPVPVRILDEAGVDARTREAVAFALLGRETLAGRAGNLPAVTGATAGVVLGTICPGGPR